MKIKETNQQFMAMIRPFFIKYVNLIQSFFFYQITKFIVNIILSIPFNLLI